MLTCFIGIEIIKQLFLDLMFFKSAFPHLNGEKTVTKMHFFSNFALVGFEECFYIDTPKPLTKYNKTLT